MIQWLISRGTRPLGTLLLMMGVWALPGAPPAGAASTWQGTLGRDAVWGPQQSPCEVVREFIVPKGIGLTILPGTTVRFSEGTRMVIRGRLVAEGTPNEPIRFTRAGESGHWLGLQFRETIEDNRIRHALLEYARTHDGMIGLEKSRLSLEYVEFDHCDRRRIRTLDSSLIVRRCRFRDIFGPNEPPTTDNLSEHLWGSGISDGGQLLIEENVFGTTKGHNDAIDFDGPASPKPIPHIRNNLFLGGGDDALDLECDALIEGNVFTHFIKDPYNKASGEANVLSAGAGRHYVLRHNVFTDAQHVVQVKNDAFLTFVNNTAVSISGAAVYLDLDLPYRKPGRGVLVENSIFWKTPTVFAGVEDEADLTVNYSCLPSSWHRVGAGNIDADPRFVREGRWDPNVAPDSPPDEAWIEGDYHLKSQAGRWDADRQRWIEDHVTSPCIDAGDPDADWTDELWPHGGRINMGAYGGTSQAGMSLSVVGYAADLNHDDNVDTGDLAILADPWLAETPPLAADIDRSGSVDLRDFARLAGQWQAGLSAWREPFEIALSTRAQWSPLHTGYDPELPGYHLVGDIASITLRARSDDLPDRLVLAVRTSPWGVPMMEGFTLAAPCFKIEGGPIKGAGLTCHSRADSTLPWRIAPEVEADAYLRFAVVGDEIRITFLPPALELLRLPCTVSWIDWYR